MNQFNRLSKKYYVLLALVLFLFAYSKCASLIQGAKFFEYNTELKKGSTEQLCMDSKDNFVFFKGENLDVKFQWIPPHEGFVLNIYKAGSIINILEAVTYLHPTKRVLSYKADKKPMLTRKIYPNDVHACNSKWSSLFRKYDMDDSEMNFFPMFRIDKTEKQELIPHLLGFFDKKHDILAKVISSQRTEKVLGLGVTDKDARSFHKDLFKKLGFMLFYNTTILPGEYGKYSYQQQKKVLFGDFRDDYYKQNNQLYVVDHLKLLMDNLEVEAQNKNGDDAKFEAPALKEAMEIFVQTVQPKFFEYVVENRGFIDQAFQVNPSITNIEDIVNTVLELPEVKDILFDNNYTKKDGIIESKIKNYYKSIDFAMKQLISSKKTIKHDYKNASEFPRISSMWSRNNEYIRWYFQGIIKRKCIRKFYSVLLNPSDEQLIAAGLNEFTKPDKWKLLIKYLMMLGDIDINPETLGNSYFQQPIYIIYSGKLLI